MDANSAQFEAFLGFTWFFGTRDKDADGIVDSEDECPDQAEDFDGFQDMEFFVVDKVGLIGVRPRAGRGTK